MNFCKYFGLDGTNCRITTEIIKISKNILDTVAHCSLVVGGNLKFLVSDSANKSILHVVQQRREENWIKWFCQCLL